MPVITGEKLKSLNTQLDEYRENGLHDTDEWLRVYRDGLNYIFNNQLANKKMKDGWDPITANYIFPAMMQELAVLSQRQQTILARPVEGGDDKFAKMWQEHFQWLYRNDLDMVDFLLRASLDGKIAGYYIAKTIWEPRPRLGWDTETKKWTGRVKCNLILPAFFATDPDAESLDESTYVFTARRVNKEWAKRRWPGHGKEIDQAANAGEEYDDRAKRYYETVAIEDKPDTSLMNEDQSRIVNLISDARHLHLTEQGKENRDVMLEEFHFDDYEERTNSSREDIPEEELIKMNLAQRKGTALYSTETGDMLGPMNWPRKEGLQYKEPVYPRGRMVLRVGKTILNPKTEDQIYPYHRRPFVVGVNHLLPHVWRGLNGVEMGRDLQDCVNIGAQHLLNNIKFFGDPQWDVEDGALLGANTPKKIAERLKAAAGKIVVLNKGKLNAIQRVPPPPVSTGVVEAYRMSAQELRDQLGTQEVGLGRPSEGDQTKAEIIRLETNTKLRGALSNKLLDDFTIRLWKNIAELVQRHYEPGRILRVIGEKHAATMQEYSQGMKDVRFDIDLEVGTKLPYDIERKRMNLGEAIQMLGPLPSLVKRWLDASDISNPEEIMAELPMFQQFQQFIQEQQGAENVA